MSVFQRLSQWVRHFSATIALFLLTVVVPSNGKRMMFMTALYVKLKGIIPTKPEELKPLVTDLHVASTPTELMFAGNIDVVEWDGDTIARIQQAAKDSDAALKSVCMSIVNNTPRIFQYGRKDDMVADMIDVVNFTQRHQSEA